jgi:hypothetical protein
MELKVFIIMSVITISTAVVALSGCGRREMSEEEKAEREARGRLLIMGRAFQDNTYPEIQGEERSRQARLYAALEWQDIEEVQVCLDGGANPDMCLSGQGWKQNNPLSVIIRGKNKTYNSIKLEKEIPDPIPDIAIIRILRKAGADFNKRPYVWETVWVFDKKKTDGILQKPEMFYNGAAMTTSEEAAEEASYYVVDTNRVIMGLIEGGAILIREVILIRILPVKRRVI